MDLGSEPRNLSATDRVWRAAASVGDGAGALRDATTPRVRSAWIRFHRWADGVPIKWKIFGIAIIGGIMTVLVMSLSLFSIWQIERSSDNGFKAVRARDDVISARVKFGEVRTQLFRLAAEPSIGTTNVQDAIAALGEAGSALDEGDLPEGSRTSVASLKAALVAYVGNARGMAERIAPGYAGPLELTKFDNQQAPLESVFDYAARDADQAAVTTRAGSTRLLFRVKLLILGATLLALVVLLVMSLRLTLILVREFGALASMTNEVRHGNLAARTGIAGNDEIGTLARGLDEMAESIAVSAVQRETAHRRELFRNGLVDALEMVDNEFAAARVVQRALADLVPEEPAELLLADSSRAHLRRVARNPLVSPPDCQVGTPFDCAAVRKATTLVFGSSGSLSACPVLAERGGTPCSAVCAPVSFMGESLGVIHIVGPEGEPLDESIVKQVETLASQTGNRIGTLRAFTQTHLQATTDGLTGIFNRRSFEDAVRRLTQESTPFALVMADLDHFKSLNDTHGHETGDRALRLFARVLKESVRADDVVARFGGEEFVVALPRSTADQAVKLLERVQFALAAAISQASVPTYTASFGVATHNDDSLTLEDVLRAADGALYQAKSSGRNRIVVAGQELSQADDGSVEVAIGDALLDAL